MSDTKARRPRLRKRRVLIRLEARNTEDARSLLESVESVFRPTDVQIDVVESSSGIPEEDVTRRMAVEPLETAAKAEARKRLDEKDAALRRQPETSIDDRREVAAEITRQRNWASKARGFGWAMFRVAVEFAQALG